MLNELMKRERPIELTFSHYNDKPTWEPRAELYAQCIGPKPNGVWLSVDGKYDWPHWCASEGFRTELLAYRHVFEITDPSRVALLDHPAHISEMTEQWRADPPGYPQILRGDSWNLDWPTITQQCGGMIIAPYHWSQRLRDNTRWYYGWDCASGCVWDLSLLRHVKSEPFDWKAHYERLTAQEDA